MPWCGLFVFSCALLSHSGDLSSCLDVELSVFSRVYSEQPLLSGQASSSPPGYSNATFQTSSCVLLKESPIEGPSPETEPVQFKALCDAFEI